jgi:hypothetical protein
MSKKFVVVGIHHHHIPSDLSGSAVYVFFHLTFQKIKFHMNIILNTLWLILEIQQLIFLLEQADENNHSWQAGGLLHKSHRRNLKLIIS